MGVRDQRTAGKPVLRVVRLPHEVNFDGNTTDLIHQAGHDARKAADDALAVDLSSDQVLGPSPVTPSFNGDPVVTRVCRP
jgi:hypothetical protein